MIIQTCSVALARILSSITATPSSWLGRHDKIRPRVCRPRRPGKNRCAPVAVRWSPLNGTWTTSPISTPRHSGMRHPMLRWTGRMTCMDAGTYQLSCGPGAERAASRSGSAARPLDSSHYHRMISLASIDESFQRSEPRSSCFGRTRRQSKDGTGRKPSPNFRIFRRKTKIGNRHGPDTPWEQVNIPIIDCS